jgi:hypothetical protein
MGVDKDLSRQVVNLAKDKLGLDWLTGEHVEACWALSKDADGPIKVVCSTRLVDSSLLVNKQNLTGTNMRVKNDLPWAMGDLLRQHKTLIENKWKEAQAQQGELAQRI